MSISPKMGSRARNVGGFSASVPGISRSTLPPVKPLPNGFSKFSEHEKASKAESASGGSAAPLSLQDEAMVFHSSLLLRKKA